MVKSVMITPDSKISEVSEEEEDAFKEGRNWDGRSLLVPEHWNYDQKFRLTLTFPDMYGDGDAYNPLATMLLHNLRHPMHPKLGGNGEVMCGTVFVSNENANHLLDFTKPDFKYVLDKCLRIVRGIK